jgi:cytosine/adenosine deaminase-related metal-dependent hydrolase
MRKFTADYLFTGREMAEKGSILVTKDDGTIEAILPPANGENRGADPGMDPADDVEVLPGLLTPGFVNCHCHLELSHMKGLLPEKAGMVDFLLAVIRGRGTTSEKDLDIILDAIAGAEESMLHNGIVAVGDICNTSHTLQQKGEGRMYYHNFIETMGFIEQTAPDRYNAALQVFQDFAGAYTLPIAANSLVPHAPYSVSPRLFRLITGFPGNQLMTIHNQESQAENLFCETGQGDFLRLYQALGLDVSFFTGTGKRSLASYLPHLYRNQTLLLVHNVDTREEDLKWLQQWTEGVWEDGRMDSEEEGRMGREGGGRTGSEREGRRAGEGDGRIDSEKVGRRDGEGDSRIDSEREGQRAGEGDNRIDSEKAGRRGGEGDSRIDSERDGRTDGRTGGGGVRGKDLRWCLCPNANLYIGGQLPDVDLLMRYGSRIILGTDSLASNHQLDILEEMKTLQQHFGHLSTATLLQWATYNGAEALQLDGVLGEFAPGKQPGVVHISGMENGRFTKGSRAQRLI